MTVYRKMTFPILFLLLAGGAMLAQATTGEPPVIPDYSQMERAQVPEIFKWRVEDIYPSLDAWQADKAEVMQMAAGLEKMAPGWTASAQNMFAFIDLATELQKKGMKLFVYASLQSDMDMANPQFQKMKGEMQYLFVGIQSKLSFVESDILTLGEAKLEAYAAEEPRLEPYMIGFRRTLRRKDHILPPDQQKIVTQMGLFTNAPSKASSLLNDVDIPNPAVTLSDGSEVNLNYANYARYRAAKDPADRRKVMETYWTNHARYENTFAALLDAGMKQHVFNARIHQYPDCLSARLFDENIDPAVYHNLVRTVRANLEPLHRLLQLRQRLLQLEDMGYGDIYASAVRSVDKTYTFEQARDLIMAAMAPLGPMYTKGLQKAFDEGWIDVYPNKGKQSGAYSSGVYGVHPYVKMNYNGSYDNVSTLAHELGHSMHSYFSNMTQHFANARYPTFLAEIASTFNENMLMHQLLQSESDDLFKLYVLDSYLERLRSTIYRQTLFAEFELAMHQAVEQGRTLTPDWLNEQYLNLTRYYYGHEQGVIDVEEYIQNEWSGIPHFYMNYYVFQYSTGIMASMALSDMVLNGGEDARERYLTFLKAGGSQFPLDTLKDAGVDMTTPAPLEAAMRQLGQLVDEMEKIVERLEKTRP